MPKKKPANSLKSPKDNLTTDKNIPEKKESSPEFLSRKHKPFQEPKSLSIQNKPKKPEKNKSQLKTQQNAESFPDKRSINSGNNYANITNSIKDKSISNDPELIAMLKRNELFLEKAKQHVPYIIPPKNAEVYPETNCLRFDIVARFN